MKKRIVIIIIITYCLGFSNILYSQKGKFSKSYIKKMDIAHNEISIQNYHLALPLLRELWDIDSSSLDVSFMLGQCLFYSKKETQESFPYFKKASIRHPEAFYFLGRLFHNQSLFDYSLEAYMEYKNTAPDPMYIHSDIDLLIEKANTAKKIIKSNLSSTITVIPEPINSPYADYGVVLNPDGNTIYFTSRRKESTGGLTDPYHDYFEDVFFSERKDQKWESIFNIGSPVNTGTHDAVVALSKDGSTLYIYRTNQELTGGDIYSSELNNNTWTEPKKIDANINTPGGAETSITLSPDGNTIYFSSNRPGGYGGKDIYRVTKMPDGAWSNAMNLGPIINTKWDEDAPFLHPNGVDFYFSSRGHENIGGFDIFKSNITEKGTFTSPINLGYPTNSVKDDIFYVVTHDAKKAYFSSNREEGIGNYDIYQTEPSDDDQKNMMIFKGTITTNDPVFMALKATITIIDISTKGIQGIYRTNQHGKYLIVLVPKKKYKVIVESEGYYSYTDEIDLTEKLQIEDLFKAINLKRDLSENN